MTFQAFAGADTLIAESALQVVANVGPLTVIVAGDSDVLVLLVHHFHPHMVDVFMLSDKSVCNTAYSVVTPVHQISAGIGTVVASELPLIQAIQ